MVSTKMKAIPPLEMGSKTYRPTKGTFGNSRKLGPKRFLKTYTRAKLKKTSWCQKFRSGKKTQSKKKGLYAKHRDRILKAIWTSPKLETHCMMNILLQNVLQKARRL
jgi:hypothetical protein